MSLRVDFETNAIFLVTPNLSGGLTEGKIPSGQQVVEVAKQIHTTRGLDPTIIFVNKGLILAHQPTDNDYQSIVDQGNRLRTRVELLVPRGERPSPVIDLGEILPGLRGPTFVTEEQLLDEQARFSHLQTWEDLLIAGLNPYLRKWGIEETVEATGINRSIISNIQTA